MRLIITIVAALILTACSGYGYRAQSFGIGYWDRQIDANTFRVMYTGDSLASYERVEDFLLLRSAELAAQHGFPHFVMLNSNATALTTDMQALPGQAHTTGSAFVAGNTVAVNSTTTYVPPAVVSVTHVMLMGTVVGLKDKPANAVPGKVYDTQIVLASTREKYGIK